MTKVKHVTSNATYTKKTTGEKEKQHQQAAAAAGVGGAAGLTAQATKVASKQGLKAQAAHLEQSFQNTVQTVNRANQSITRNKKVATGLWATFKKNVGKFSDSILKRFKNLENTKFIGPIVKSPITKKFASACGGALAFFVLISGVTRAFKTGALAFDDLKQQYNEMYA